MWACVIFILLLNFTFSAFTRHSLIKVALTPKSSAQTGLNTLGHGMDLPVISFFTICSCFVFSTFVKGLSSDIVSGVALVVGAEKLEAELSSCLIQATSAINCQSEIWTNLKNFD